MLPIKSQSTKANRFMCEFLAQNTLNAGRLLRIVITQSDRVYSWPTKIAASAQGSLASRRRPCNSLAITLAAFDNPGRVVGVCRLREGQWGGVESDLMHVRLGEDDESNSRYAACTHHVAVCDAAALLCPGGRGSDWHDDQSVDERRIRKRHPAVDSGSAASAGDRRHRGSHRRSLPGR